MARNLLILDDDRGITTVLEYVAMALGYEVRVLDDSRQAVGVYEASQHDALVLDIIMPQIDGVDVLNDLLRRQSIPRVILMSGLSEPYLRLAEGVAAFHTTSLVTVRRGPFRRRFGCSRRGRGRSALGGDWFRRQTRAQCGVS